MKRVLLACLVALAACRARPVPAEPAALAGDADPSVLVLAHSWSGHTQRVAKELGRMLGTRVVVMHDGPGPDAPTTGALVADELPKVSLAGVRTMLLGLPVWDESPSPVASRLVAALPLAGVRVVPFYTFIHYLEPK